jgi:ABC-type microcin C transport system duplicated ATPase subunit YejF
MDDPEDRVLHDVSFQVEPGQTVALVGPTGRAARAEGFKRMELMATMAGEPLYRACGYEPDTYLMDDRGGVPVPLLRMTKWL